MTLLCSSDCGTALRCSQCAELLSECECPNTLPGVGPDVYCPDCDPKEHIRALENAEYLRKVNAELHRQDMEDGVY